MGAALNTAGAMNGYVLSDRRHLDRIQEPGRSRDVVEGDKRLFNTYGVMLVNPEKYPPVKKELGQTLIDWLVSPEGQAAIAGYKIDGQTAVLSQCGEEGGLNLQVVPANEPVKNTTSSLRSLRSKRLEGWTQRWDSRPSFETRAKGARSSG